MSEGGEEGFLARWSRRKRQAAQAPLPEPAPPPPPAPPGPAPPGPAPLGPVAEAAPAEAAAPPEFDPASLPPVESLTAESDITAFLRMEVPAALRQAALRRIWSLDPAIRDFVGPADYAWDFNVPDGMPGFAPELVGDVKRLLAQAIGLTEGEERPAALAAAAPSEDPPALAGSEPWPSSGPEVGTEPPPPVAPRPAEAAAPTAAPAPPPPRRHGRALPS